jgi:hypothetical protein
MNPALSIHIVPELGWTMLENEPVFGPGSVIQGHVRLADPSLLAHADRLRLIFHGSERTLYNPIHKNQFFGSQLTLWDNKQPPSIATAFDFTLQLPLVQFPPSINHDLYNCYYKLTVFLDCGGTTTFASKGVILRPFLETTRLQTPLMYGPLSIPALDYLPGDTLRINLSSPTRMRMTLEQTVAVNRAARKQKVKIVSTTSTDLLLPLDLTPSFSFSPVVSVSYHLTVKIHASTGTRSVITWPIHIGTLSYGLRVDLPIYSVFSSAFDSENDGSALPLPVFLKADIDGDTLPQYEADHLPAYA